MAKKKPASTNTSAATDDLELAAKCISHVTGCGIITARRRAKNLKPETVSEIARLESENKRTDAVSLIYS